MTDCEICYEAFGTRSKVVLVCSHSVCLDCFLNIHGGDCPFCRANAVIARYEGGTRIEILYAHWKTKAPLILSINLDRTLFSDIKKLIILSNYLPHLGARQMRFIREVPLKGLDDDKTCSFYNIKEGGTILVCPRLSGD